MKKSMTAFALIFISLTTILAQPKVLERIYMIKSDGVSYRQYNSFRSGYPSLDFHIPKGKTPSNYYQYVFPNDYSFQKLDNQYFDLLNFDGGDYSAIVELDFEADELKIDETGLHTYKTPKKEINGHYGVYLGKEPLGFSQLAYIWIIPEDFEFVSYDVNREGEWVVRDNSLSFFGYNVNDLIFEIKYRKKRTTPTVFKERKVKVKKQIALSSNSPVLKVRDTEKEDGDIISISLNGDWIARGLHVTNREVEIALRLRKGRNYLIMYAENEGEIPPNTAAMKVGLQEVILNSSKDSSEALELIVN
ncbi:hypothetical protein [Phaeodactylibacter xiamenensis]|uniref:hypothetical protein n=1 Tax=Phaeodactylibacter xiamenensis TaxID=1524460 RepID=UPI0024A845F7|nr:hypothetical protein [Phaeodactylibacter xiamenensis]